MGVGHSPGNALAKSESRSSSFSKCGKTSMSEVIPLSVQSRPTDCWSLFQSHRTGYWFLNRWTAGWALCQSLPPTIRLPVLLEDSRSLLSQSRRRDCRRHRRQNPTSHSRLQRLPATRQRPDQGCFVSFSCAYGVVLNRRRTPSSAAGAVVSLIKKVGDAKVFQEIVCRALFAGSGIHPLRRVSYLQVNADAHRLGLNGSAAQLCQPPFL